MKKKDGANESKNKKNALQGQIQELQDKNIRLLAEMENLRRQKAEEVSNASKYSKTRFASDMINVLDQLNMALSETEKLEKEAEKQKSPLLPHIQSMSKGMQYVKQGMQDALKGHRVEKISPLGNEFDPLHHDAVRVVESEIHPHNKVIRVLSYGFKIEDRILRPAKVEVSKNLKSQKQ